MHEMQTRRERKWIHIFTEMVECKLFYEVLRHCYIYVYIRPPKFGLKMALKVETCK